MRSKIKNELIGENFSKILMLIYPFRFRKANEHDINAVLTAFSKK